MVLPGQILAKVTNFSYMSSNQSLKMKEILKSFAGIFFSKIDCSISCKFFAFCFIFAKEIQVLSIYLKYKIDLDK